MNKKQFTIADFEKQLTENFKVKEFACKDNTQHLLLDIDNVDILQKIRYIEKVPIIVVSAYRSEQHNIICGGAKTSKHLTGDAIDFRFSENENRIERLVNSVLNLYYSFNVKGIGLYINRGNKNMIHFDNRPIKTIWVNNGKTQKYYAEFYDYLLGKNEIKSVAL